MWDLIVSVPDYCLSFYFAENFKVFTDWTQMIIYLLSFLFDVINVVDYFFLCLYNFIRSLVAL